MRAIDEKKLPEVIVTLDQDVFCDELSQKRKKNNTHSKTKKKQKIEKKKLSSPEGQSSFFSSKLPQGTYPTDLFFPDFLPYPYSYPPYPPCSPCSPYSPCPPYSLYPPYSPYPPYPIHFFPQWNIPTSLMGGSNNPPFFVRTPDVDKVPIIIPDNSEEAIAEEALDQLLMQLKQLNDVALEEKCLYSQYDNFLEEKIKNLLIGHLNGRDDADEVKKLKIKGLMLIFILSRNKKPFFFGKSKKLPYVETIIQNNQDRTRRNLMWCFELIQSDQFERIGYIERKNFQPVEFVEKIEKKMFIDEYRISRLNNDLRKYNNDCNVFFLDKDTVKLIPSERSNLFKEYEICICPFVVCKSETLISPLITKDNWNNIFQQMPQSIQDVLGAKQCDVIGNNFSKNSSVTFWKEPVTTTSANNISSEKEDWSLDLNEPTSP